MQKKTVRHASTPFFLLTQVFNAMRQWDLLLAQPSVCDVPGSSSWKQELAQRGQFALRFVTFVEIMAPAFRMDFFDKGVAYPCYYPANQE
jgi:hypothetical protein